MKYLYTICLALSSFFIYKPLNADTNIRQNAFFIPGGAFQQNIQNSTQQVNPRRRLNKNFSTQETPPAQAEIPLSQRQDSAVTSKPHIISEEQTAPTAKATATETTDSVALTTDVFQESSKPQKIKQNIAKKTQKNKKQYAVEKTITATTPEKSTEKNTRLSTLEQFQQKSMQEMLNTLPYPDFNLPKYKQIYALYALELRSAYRRGKLPSNYEQEETLAKANSIRRFDVK